MDFDSILDEIGEFGRFQYVNYFLVCLPVFFAAANSLSYVFTAAVPNYRCLVPDCDIKGNFDESWVHFAVPGTIDKNGFSPQHCYRYTRNYTVVPQEPMQCFEDMFTSEKERCSQWVFDKGERTIVNDWLITCPENQWKLAFVGTSHFAGIIVGSAAAGVLADNYGRKLVLVACILFMSVTGVVNALSTNYELFTFFTFLNAIGTSGIFPLAFIIGVEMVGRKKRELTGIVLNYFYALGEAATGLIAWLCRDWVSIQMLVSAPPFAFIIYYWIVPESVRWLLAKKRNRKAEKIIKKAAHVNGVKLSAQVLATFGDDSDCDNSLIENPTEGEGHGRSDDVWGTFKAMMKSNIFIFRMLILYYNWATCAFVFYGLSLNSVNLSGNKYLNFILISLVEIPGYSLAWFFMNRIGRRWSLAMSLIICGVTCIASIYSSELFPELPWLSVTLSLIGKMGVTASFGVIYVYSAEMLPTIIRSGGVGSMSTFARVGALVAPFVPLLSYVSEILPMLLFGLVSVVGGFLIFFLPETLGYKLPESVEDALSIGRVKPTNVPTRDRESNAGYSPKTR